MRLNLNFIAYTFAAIFLCACGTNENTKVVGMPDGVFTYNLPCKVVNINQNLEGKSTLVIWLHGGVKDRAKHDLFEFNHLDCCDADENIANYLQNKGIKSIILHPVCYRAVNPECVTWKECYDDVKHMIDDYVEKGLVDPSRIYVTGSSDGGTGTWDYAEMHPEVFAAAIAMSCGRPRNVNEIPVYFFNTASERDYTHQVDSLKQLGATIEYKHCPQYKHGGDAAECTEEFLDKFFSHVKE